MKAGSGGKPAFPRLGKRLCGGILAEGLKGLSLWAALASTAWSLGNAAFIALSPPWWATAALGLSLLSLAPAFFFSAVNESSLTNLLRSLDEGTAIEAALSPGEGPAYGLIADRARAIDEAIPFKAVARRRLFKGMGRFWLAAMAGLAILELMALVILNRPAIAYRPQESAAGSGLGAVDSGALRPLGTTDEAKEGMDESRTAARKENLPSGGSVALSQEELQAAFDSLAQTREERLAMADSGAAPASGTGGEEEDAKRGTQKGEGAEAGSGAAGEPQPGDPGSKAKGRNARGQGYEGSDTGLPPSPLVDYRARLFQALTERGGKGVTTGESIDMAALRDYQRRFFGSFAMDAPLAPHDDPYSAMLKLRWGKLGEAFR
jgi:hypothetical protein